MRWGAISADPGRRFTEGYPGCPGMTRSRSGTIRTITGMTMAATSAEIVRNIGIPWSSRMSGISLAYHEKPNPDADERYPDTGRSLMIRMSQITAKIPSLNKNRISSKTDI
jgi:hypothetical protein